MGFALMLAAVLIETGANGLELKVESETAAVDPARSVFLTVTLKTPSGIRSKMPDLRDRVRGFSLAEDFAEEPRTESDGSTVETVNWKLVPEPCAEEYKIAPFVVRASPKLLSAQSDDGKFSFYAGPIRFGAPAKRETVTGEMECDPQKDLPPLSWKLVLQVTCVALGAAAAVLAAWLGLRYLARRVKEHRMSPVERAWAELDRLLKRGLPGRGRYKDFYVELTMVVRRYVQRKYGIRAPHLTTEEFLSQFKGGDGRPPDELRQFLESADMVKFAGVTATPEMADAATDSARQYIRRDSVN